MTAKKTKTTDAPVVSPLLDASGNPTLVSAGELIESAWGNSVAGRVVPRYPSKAVMDTVAGGNGSMAVTNDRQVVWFRDAGVWKPTALGNVVSFRGLGRAGGQSIPVSTLATCTWNVVSDPFAVTSSGGAIFTCPVGWAGRWVFEWGVEFTVGGSVGDRLSYCAIPGGRIGEQNSMPLSGGTRMTGSASVVLNPGETTGIVMYHTDTTVGGALTVNPTVNTYFQGYYLGPLF